MARFYGYASLKGFKAKQKVRELGVTAIESHVRSWDHGIDDFKFYCDEGERENHVYLKAYEYIYGPKAAETLLNEERGHK